MARMDVRSRARHLRFARVVEEHALVTLLDASRQSAFEVHVETRAQRRAGDDRLHGHACPTQDVWQTEGVIKVAAPAAPTRYLKALEGMSKEFGQEQVVG